MDASWFVGVCRGDELAAICLSLSDGKRRTRAPPRPRGVPQEAVWAGGIDGGDFILLGPATPDGTYFAKIYNDHSGDLEFSGKLRLKAPGTAPIDVANPKTYSDWDGTSLSLRDGRILQRVGK